MNNQAQILYCVYPHNARTRSNTCICVSVLAWMLLDSLMTVPKGIVYKHIYEKVILYSEIVSQIQYACVPMTICLWIERRRNRNREREGEREREREVTRMNGEWGMKWGKMGKGVQAKYSQTGGGERQR